MKTFFTIFELLCMSNSKTRSYGQKIAIMIRHIRLQQTLL